MLLAELAVRVALTTCTNLACPGAAGCDQQLGPASVNGEDAQIGYDINVGTGNMFYSEQDVDLEPALGPPLRFARYYNSQNTSLSFGLGNGWTHSYSWQASIPSSGTVKIVRESGRALYFTGSGPASWTPQTGEFGTLTGVADGGFTYTTKYGEAYAFDNTTSNSGRLLSITPADNTAIAISYNAGTNNIATVTSGNQTLTFAYSGTNVSSVTDPVGDVWSYSVVGGNLASATLPNNDGSGNYEKHTYTYSNVTVDSIVFSNGGDSSALTEVQKLQSAGTTVTSRLTSYDVNHRAVRVDTNYLTTFNGDVQISYTLCTNQPSTTVATLSGGSKTITSGQTSGFQRMTALTATAGIGDKSEWASAAYSWNANLTLSQLTDGNSNVRTYNSYDTKGNPTSITEASGTALARTTTYTYHSILSAPLTVTRLSVDGTHSHIIVYDYDSDYNATYNQAPTKFLHQIADTGYTDVTLSGTVGSQQTYTTQIYYDGSNRITNISEPNGHGTTISYWPTGSAHNASSRVETVEVTGLSSLSWTYNNYDLDGRLLQFSDPNGVSFTSTFDPIGRILSKNVAQGATSLTDSFTYDLAGDLIKHTTPEGTGVFQEFNAASQMWRRRGTTTTPSNVWSEIFDFNSVNQVVAMRRFSGLGTDPLSACAAGGTEQFCVNQANDAFSRVSSFSTLTSSDTSCTSPTCTVTLGYDNNGNPTSRNEANINVTTYGYDQLNRINKITLPTGYYSTLTYDINGNLATRRDPRDSHNSGTGGGGRLTTYVYDDFGRLISVSTPDMGSFISNYDGSGLLLSALDGNGTTINYSYDGANRLTKMASSTANDTVNYSYDETGSIGSSTYADTLGRVSSILGHDSSGNVINLHYIYDLMGRVASELDERGPTGSTTFSTTSYGWGNDNELTSLTYPDGEIVTYGYPALTSGFAPIPLPQSVSAPYSGSGHTIASNVAYFSDGVASGLTYGNGDTRSLSRNRRGEGTLLTSGSTGSVVNQTYAYDSNGLGNLASVVNFSGLVNHWTWSFGYDSLNRLTSYGTTVRPGGDSYSWTYDEVGNRLTQVYDGTNTTYTYDAAKDTNQVASLSGGASDTWTYTAGGQVLTHTASSTTTTHHYDTRQLLASDTVSGVTTASYTYDGLGQRWSKDVASTGYWTDFYYDIKGRILQEYSYNGATVNGANAYDVVDHIYLGPGAGEVGRVVRRYEKPTADGGYAFVDMDLEYVHEDYRGGPFGIENGSTLAWEAEVDPFDNAIHVGLPGTDGKIGTADDTAATITNYFGGGGTYRDSESEFIAGAGGNRWRGNVAALGAPQPASVLDLSGSTSYGNNGHAAQLSTMMQPLDFAAAGGLSSEAIDQIGDGLVPSSGLLPAEWSREDMAENDIDPGNSGPNGGPTPWQTIAPDDDDPNSMYAINEVNDYASLFSSTVAVDFAATSQLPTFVSMSPGAVGSAMCPPLQYCGKIHVGGIIGHLPKNGDYFRMKAALALAVSAVGQLPALGHSPGSPTGSLDVTNEFTSSASGALSSQSQFVQDPRLFSAGRTATNFNTNLNIGKRF